LLFGFIYYSPYDTETQSPEARVRVSTNKIRKKEACPARVAEAGQGNIETVHEPEPIQTIGTLCMDRVAVLWKVPMAHKLRYMKEFMPSR
jgi:hypothetical protein